MAIGHDVDKATPAGDVDAGQEHQQQGGAVHARVMAVGPDPAALRELLSKMPHQVQQILQVVATQYGNSVMQATKNARPAAGLGTGKVIASQLHVRSTPTQTEDNVVGVLSHGQQVDPVAKHGEWLEIPHGPQKAFVKGEWVQLDPEGKQADAQLPQFQAPPPGHAIGPAPTTPAPAPVTPVASADTLKPTVALPPPSADATHHDAPPAHVEAPAAAVATETTATSYLHNYKHLEGGGTLDTDPTTPDEAKILNAIRADNRKLEPKYLKELQTTLKVANNSGAFNTETLRALKKHYPSTPVTKDSILKGDILIAILPGTPIVNVGNGAGQHDQRGTGQVGKGERKGDAMARVAGYASYAEMSDQFVTIKLLGSNLGTGMPHLAARVALADAWLQQRHPLDPNDEKAKTWKDVAKNKLGWSYSGNASYSADINQIGMTGIVNGVAVGPHMHSAGLALDIDVEHNPYVFAGGDMAKGSNGVDPVMTKHLDRAAKMYGGDPVTPAELYGWAQKYSTEELYARVDMLSKSLGQYLKLAESGDEKITAALKEHNLPADADSRDSVKRFHDFFKSSNMGRQKAEGLMNHSMDMVVALRDVAGLSWGGAEMSERQNGDFMHFDCRNDAIGANVHQFSLNNQDVVDEENHKADTAPKKP